MSTSTHRGSLEKLVAELQADPTVPLVLAGERVSGRSEVIRAAAAQLGYDVVEQEAIRLSSPLGGHPPAGGVAVSHSHGLSTALDDLRTVAPLSLGSPTLVVIDHLELMTAEEIAAVTQDVQRLAALMPVVVVATPNEARRLPSSWRTIDHGIADRLRWRPQARNRPAVAGLAGV